MLYIVNNSKVPQGLKQVSSFIILLAKDKVLTIRLYIIFLSVSIKSIKIIKYYLVHLTTLTLYLRYRALAAVTVSLIKITIIGALLIGVIV